MVGFYFFAYGKGLNARLASLSTAEWPWWPSNAATRYERHARLLPCLGSLSVQIPYQVK